MNAILNAAQAVIATQGPGFWLAAVLAAVLVGLSKGGLPMVGMLGVPILSLSVTPVQAAGLLLPVYVLSDLVGLWAYRRAFDRRVVAMLLPGAVAGIALGWASASLVPEPAVRLMVGLIGISFVASLILRRNRPPAGNPAPRWGAGSLWGGLAGFTSFVSHAGAPPYQVFVQPLRLEKAVFAGTTTVFFALVNAVKLIPYAALGQLDGANLALAAVLVVPAVLAVLAGVVLVRHLPERLFFQGVTAALALISIKLCIDGALALWAL